MLLLLFFLCTPVCICYLMSLLLLFNAAVAITAAAAAAAATAAAATAFVQADGYTIPANRPPSATASETRVFELSQFDEKTKITRMAADGSFVETEGTRMRSARV